MSGYALYSYDIQNLEGDILTIVESFGLRDSQERAAKNLIRNALYMLYRLPQIEGSFLNDAISKTQAAGIGWGGGIPPAAPTN